MQNLMVVFNFSVFDQKHSFWANLVQKIKIVSLSRKLVLRTIEYAEFNGAVHFFCFRLETPFLGKFDPKHQSCQFKLKFVT